MENNRPIAGLVLEGGAMRGMYTAAILDTMYNNGIEFDKMVGVSAGALFGVNVLSKQPGRAIRYSKKFNSDRKYMGMLPLLKEGNLFSTDYAYDKVPKYLDPFDDDTYMKSETEFYAVVTDVFDGSANYIRIRSVFEQMDVLRASASMPVVSKPVVINGHKYLDGALSDSIPFEWMEKQNVEKMVVILTQDISYRKKPMKKALCNLYKGKYPRIAERMANRHKLYNNQLDKLRELEEAGKAFVFRPSEPITIGRAEKDPAKLQQVYELGEKDARARLHILKAYLGQE